MLQVDIKVFKQVLDGIRMSATTLLLDSVVLSSPVFLPFGQRTMPNILSASMGVTLPFAIFFVLIFQFLHGVWQENHSDDTGAKAPLLSSSSSSRRSRMAEEPYPMEPPVVAPRLSGSQRSSRGPFVDPASMYNAGAMNPYSAGSINTNMYGGGV